MTSAVCLPPVESLGLARMLSWTSELCSGSVVTKVSVCGMSVVLPVASLFSKTIVAGPATAVSGAVLYRVVSLSAVQVSTCSAAPAPGVPASWPWAAGGAVRQSAASSTVTSAAAARRGA